MKRRRFLRGLGFGGAVAAVTAPSAAAAASQSETRDLKWAKAQCAKGHRVRLETWRVPVSARPEVEHGPGVATSQGGTPAGVENVTHLLVSVEVLEGPWELVPESDYPKPPPPPVPCTGSGGDIVIGNAYPSSDYLLTTGECTLKMRG